MARISRLFFKYLLCSVLFLSSCFVFGQSYDGPVGKNEIPSTYQGFDDGKVSNQADNILNGTNAGDPGGGPCEDQDPEGVLCPIDSYLYVLLVLGVAYGYFKFGRKKVAVL